MTIRHIRGTKSFFRKNEKTQPDELDKWFEIGRRRRGLEYRLTELSWEIEKVKKELDQLPPPNKT